MKTENTQKLREQADLILTKYRYRKQNAKKDKVIKSRKSQMDFKEYKKRIIRNLKVFYDVELSLTEQIDEYDFNAILYTIDEELNTLVSTIIVLHELLEPHNIRFIKNSINLDFLIQCNNKSKTIIKEFDINPQLIPFDEEINKVTKGDFISHLNSENENFEDLKEDDEKLKYKSESILTEIFESHRGLIQSAKMSSREENERRASNKISLKTFFKYAEKIHELLNKLENYKNEDYIHNVKELLLLEKSITKVTQQKLYNEIKKQNKIEQLNKNNLINDLILKDFEKLKK